METGCELSHHQLNSPLFNVIGIETSEKCNRECSFCPNSVFQQYDRQLPEDLYGKVISELELVGYSFTIVLHGYNEPLLDMRLPMFIEIARNKLPNATIMFSSNGDFLTIKKWNELRNHGLDYMVVSQYDGVISDHIAAIAAQLGNSEKRALIIRKRKRKELNSTRGGSINIDRIPEIPLKEPCARPFCQLVIRFNGVAVLCCEDYLNEIVIGNVRSQRVFDIWNGEEIRKARTEIAMGNRISFKTCEKCNTRYQESVRMCRLIGRSRRIKRLLI